MNRRSEKSAEAVVAAGMERRAEREGRAVRPVSLGRARASEARATGANSKAGRGEAREPATDAMKHGWRDSETEGLEGEWSAGRRHRRERTWSVAWQPRQGLIVAVRGSMDWTIAGLSAEYLKTVVATD